MPYQHPVGDPPPDPYEGYRVERIEADKQTKREPPKPFEEEAKRPSFALWTYLLSMFHHVLDLFREADAGIEQAVRAHLLLIKEAFETLKQEDRSQDSDFLSHLSLSWHQVLEDVPRFRKESPAAQHLNAFIKEIHSYPEGEEFTLGYYLIEYAGQKWLPFPYMELVQNLHRQHQKDPSSSPLTRWAQQMDELVNLLPPLYTPSS